jgi:ATP-dependent DNA helicase RecG
MSILINIQDLLSGSIVEGTRMEFKKGWNAAPIMRSVCAFSDQDTDQDKNYTTQRYSINYVYKIKI